MEKENGLVNLSVSEWLFGMIAEEAGVGGVGVGVQKCVEPKSPGRISELQCKD